MNKNIDLKTNKITTIIIIGLIVAIIAVTVILIVNNYNSKENPNKEEINETIITLIGEPKVTIYVGDNYEEPGYKASLSNGKDITKQVKIDSNVNNQIVGSYMITYSVNNKYIVRYVEVIGRYLNMSLTPSTKEYVNNEVVVDIKITGSHFDYLMLPDNSKTSNMQTKYSINQNGTYKFKAFDKDGTNIEKEIEIKNIDKESPQIDYSLASGTYTGIKKVQINVSDKLSGVSSYSINVYHNGKKNDSKSHNNITNETVTIELNKKGTWKVETIAIDKVNNTNNIEESSKNYVLNVGHNVQYFGYYRPTELLNGKNYFNFMKQMNNSNVTIVDSEEGIINALKIGQRVYLAGGELMFKEGNSARALTINLMNKYKNKIEGIYFDEPWMQRGSYKYSMGNFRSQTSFIRTNYPQFKIMAALSPIAMDTSSSKNAELQQYFEFCTDLSYDRYGGWNETVRQNDLNKLKTIANKGQDLWLIIWGYAPDYTSVANEKTYIESLQKNYELAKRDSRVIGLMTFQIASWNEIEGYADSKAKGFYWLTQNKNYKTLYNEHIRIGKEVLNNYNFIN